MFWHTLQLVIKDCFEDKQHGDDLAAARKFITLFHHSILASHELDKRQLQMNVK